MLRQQLLSARPVVVGSRFFVSDDEAFTGKIFTNVTERLDDELGFLQDKIQALYAGHDLFGVVMRKLVAKYGCRSEFFGRFDCPKFFHEERFVAI